MTNRPLHTNNPTPYQMLIVKNPKGQDGYLPEYLFRPTNISNRHLTTKKN